MRELGDWLSEPFGGYLGAGAPWVRLAGGGGGGWVEGVSGLSFTTTSTNAAWTPVGVTKSGSTLTWRVYSAAGVLLLESVANKPTFDLSALAGTKILHVTSPDGWAGLTVLDLRTLNITTMDVRVATALTIFVGGGNQIPSFDLSANVNLTRLNLYGTPITTIDISSNVALTIFDIYLSLLNTVVFGNNAALQSCNLSSNAMTQAEVDAIVADIYSRRMAFTYATPALNIGGTGDGPNAAPSGTYQASATPTTGKEMIYALVNDPNAEGFNKWTITYTA